MTKMTHRERCAARKKAVDKYNHSVKGLMASARYAKTVKGKAASTRGNRSEKGIARQRKFAKSTKGVSGANEIRLKNVRSRDYATKTSQQWTSSDMDALIVMRWQGCTYEHIAQQLGRTISAVKNRYSKIREDCHD